MASLNNNEVSYVGRTNDPWRRKNEHARDKRKQTCGVPWVMHIFKSGLSVKEAATLENALICIFKIDALANARHEVAVKNYAKFEMEFNRASSLTGIELNKLKDLMKGDY